MKVFINNEEKPILTRKYQFTRADDYKVIIQDHGAGHKYSAPGNIGDQKAQLNLRPINNPRTGKIPDARDHFYFKEKNEVLEQRGRLHFSEQGV